MTNLWPLLLLVPIFFAIEAHSQSQSVQKAIAYEGPDRRQNPSKGKRKRVRVYRNLNTGTLSLQEKRNGSWKVTRHPKSIALKNVRFHVNEAGRLKVIETGQKNVHAFVEGELAKTCSLKKGQIVKYDPKKYRSFKAGRKSIKAAEQVCIDSSGKIKAVGVA